MMLHWGWCRGLIVYADTPVGVNHVGGLVVIAKDVSQLRIAGTGILEHTVMVTYRSGW